MKNQALFSSKDKSKKLKCHLLQYLFGALRVSTTTFTIHIMCLLVADSSTVICWMNPFVILGVSGSFCGLYSF